MVRLVMRYLITISFNTKQQDIIINIKPFMASLAGITSPKKAIYNYKETTKSYKDLFYNIKKVYDSHLLEKCYSGWANFTQKSKDIKRKIWAIQYKSGNFANECFQTWRNKFHKRRHLREKIQNLFQTILLNFKYKFLARVASTYSDKVHEEYGSKKATMTYLKNLRRRTFKAWTQQIKRKLLSKKNTILGENLYYQNLLRRAFFGIHNNYTEKKLAVINHQKSLLFYAFQLKKLPFFAWKKFFLKKVLLASAVEGYQRIRMKRMAPLFVQNLKINYYLQNFNRVAIPKAVAAYERMLSEKTMLGFKLNFGSEIIKRKQEDKANIHYMSQLLMKSLRSWLAYLIEKKTNDEKRAVLYHAIQHVDNQNLLAQCFNVMKVYKEEAQEYMVDLRTIMIENGLRRILSFWKNYCDQKKYTNNVINDYKAFAFERKKSEYFSRWRKAFKMRALVYTTLRISFLRSFRTYFNTWKNAVKSFGVYEIHMQKKRKAIKGKFWDLWKDYTRKAAIENKKSLIIFDKQAKKSIAEGFQGWRKLYAAVKLVKF